MTTPSEEGFLGRSFLDWIAGCTARCIVRCIAGSDLQDCNTGLCQVILARLLLRSFVQRKKGYSPKLRVSSSMRSLAMVC